MLEELERRSEGLSAGVQEVLVRGPLDQVRAPAATFAALVADLLHVHMETAPMIEAASGRSGPVRRGRRSRTN